MSEHLIDGMTSSEWVIYNKGYTKGLDVGEAITEERVIQVIENRSNHKGKTHSINNSCSVCNLIGQIKGEMQISDFWKNLWQPEPPAKILQNYKPTSTRKQRTVWAVKNYLTNLWSAIKGATE